MTEPLAPLAPEQLRWQCDPGRFPDSGTSGLPALGDTMGQERALAALKLGLELYSPGYNIFVSGLTGTGRTYTVKRILENISPQCALAEDRAYVYNFSDPDEPRLLTLPRGVARRFRAEMAELIDYLRQTIPAIFEDDTYKQRRDGIIERYAGEERKRLEAMSAELAKDDLAVVQIQLGPMTHPEVLPVVNGDPVSMEELNQLQKDGAVTPDEAARLTERQRARKRDLEQHLAWARGWARKMTHELDGLGRQIATGAVSGPLSDLKMAFQHDRIADWLKQVETHILENLERFMPKPPPGPGRKAPQQDYLEYEVNVIQDQFGRAGCPVIIEGTPSYSNLFGTIEREAGPGGHSYTDHTKIHGGSLLRADGGYLVVNAIDLLVEPGVWTTLKRTLKTGQLNMRPPERLYPFGPTGLNPEPIPLNVKVIMIGDGGLYHMASAQEPEFRKIFKVLAEFETDVPRSDENLSRFAEVAASVVQSEGLAPLAPDGIAALLEFAVRRAGRQSRISVRFSESTDLLREADYWRRRETNAEQIGAAEIRRAIDAAKHRHNRIEERLREHIQDGVLRVETSGAQVGQVNGLAVLDFGVYAFGKPARISATCGPGRAGLINIERRANLSGSSHDKGVLIIGGFLRSRFAQTMPLALTAGLAFEQSYGGVDGDSASSTEIYALLSALSGYPVKQNFAVTGSVDQQGRIQAIGGVNEKIEGFFDVCNERGLTGDQGVLIPPSNVADLMLRPDVVQAVRDGRFAVWAVETVDQGIALLTGETAGTPDAGGRYPPDTVNGRVQARLEEFARTVRTYENPEPSEPA